jgi:hypothetical protein
VCFNTCPDRNTIHNEILLLKDSIDAMQIRMRNYNDKVTIYEEQMDILLQDKKQDRQDQEEKQENLNAAHSAAKGQAVSSMAGPSSKMSGMSQSQTHQALNNHMSKPVTTNSLEDFKKNAPKQSKDDIMKHNRQQAKLHDQQSKGGHGRAGLDAKKAANGYINKNKARCECPEYINQEHPDLENDIIDKANTFGFVQHTHGSAHCSPTDSCAKKYAKQKLRQLCDMHQCKVVNPDGQYPHQLKQMNKHSNGKRPKGYKFPN